MSYKSLLAPAAGRASDVTALNLAAQIGSVCGALVKVLPSHPDLLQDMLVMADLPVSDDLSQKVREIEKDLLTTITRMAEAAAKAAGLPLGEDDPPALRMVERGGGRWLSLLEHAPLCDLAVISWASLKDAEALGGVLVDLLFALRLPVLVARGPHAPISRPVAIAWDNSPEAGRAVRAAIPLLQTASEVVILQNAAGLNWSQKSSADPARLVQYLSLQDVGNIQIREVAGRPEGPALLLAADEAQAALLVAGGYGHSRFQEWLFGGATQAFLKHAEGPHLLLAH